MCCRYGLPQKNHCSLRQPLPMRHCCRAETDRSDHTSRRCTLVSNLHHPELMRHSQKTGSRILGIARQGNTIPPRISSDSKPSIIAINTLAGTGNDPPPALVPFRDTGHRHIEGRTVVLRHTDGNHRAGAGIRHNRALFVCVWCSTDDGHIPQHRPRVFVERNDCKGAERLPR
jgi:hypothetical protein